MVAAVLAVAVIAAVFAVRIRSDFTVDELFRDDGAQRRITADFRAEFGNTDNVLVALVEADDVLTPAPLDYLRQLTDYLSARPWALEAVSVTNFTLPRRIRESRPVGAEIGVTSLVKDIATGALAIEPLLGDGPVTRAQAEALARAVAASPLIEGRLVAPDRSVAVVAVAIRGDLYHADELESIISEVEHELSSRPPPPGVHAQLGGLPYVRVDVIRSIRGDQSVLFPAAFAAVLLLLLISFRWAPAVLLPLVTVAIAAALLVGAMAADGEPLNIINNMVPVLIIIIGISDAVHLVNRYGEELTTGVSRRAAARAALRQMAVALFFTSFTTAVGFASLVVSDLPILVRFGLTAAAGVVVTYAVTILFLPATLSLAPRPRRAIADPSHGGVERLVGPMVGAVLRHRHLVLAIAAGFTVATLVVAPRVPIDTAVHHQFDPGSQAHRALSLLEKKLDGVRPVEVDLVAAPGRFYSAEVADAVDRVDRWAASQRGVLRVVGYPDLLHEIWFVATGDPAARTAHFSAPPDAAPDRFFGDPLVHTLSELQDQAPSQLGRFVSADRSRARISLSLADIGGRAAVAFVDRLRRELAAQLPSDVSARLTGEGYVSSLNLDALTRDLVDGLLLAIGGIVIFMILALRSVRLGLLSIPPNVLPLLATVGYLWLRGISLSVGTAIIFSISIGLAVNGTIHVLARFREELAAGATRDQALAAAARGTGKAVVVSYLSIIVGFTVFQLSSFVPVRQFGELISVTIAACLVSTLVVLPALIGVAVPARLSEPTARPKA